MKKVLSFFFLIVTLSATAQNPVPNPGFETWINYGPYEDPQSWQSLNGATWPFSGVTVKKEGDSYGGNLAVKLVSIGHNNTSIAGVLCTGLLSFSTISCSGGFPVSHSYTSFEGYYKYLPAPGDSSMLYAMLTKWNVASSMRDTVAVATFSADSVADYTFFSIPFSYSNVEVPDSAQIILSSTKHLLAAPLGSILVVDDLDFSGSVGIDEITSIPPKLFPNPANDFLQLQIPLSAYSGSVDVYDCLGRKIKSLFPNTANELIYTGQFPEGIFFYTILDKEKKRIASGKFMVKH